ncbi:nitrate ABC transporter ATP-binding protein [Paenibacillus marchantiophytorum]|uniref:Nitrate ABC transporter ATP-binding protein n=1 Tax=Paenibacillus marchantiophytorum TaxID=1619310 RepID=A0ABQ2BR55_9BACL|nr:ABC transporter ATP-binding protein [Paenibacillus marchantiophytorum]GGI43836.1 nitrate ABC transporter ATP-binding protein [Paenibacillus marchantiophytorum]
MPEENAFLQLQQLSVTYPGEAHQVLSPLNIQINEGEFVCLLGPSGCGKTTLLNCMAGFQSYEGNLLLQGQPITKPGRERGVVFQEYALFPWFTVEQNVMLGPRINGLPKTERIRIARKCIRMVGLDGYETYYPNRLSGGMKQRASLARALANEPSILLLDEPFAALDEQTRETMQSELLRIQDESGVTCVFVTHSIAEAVYLADRILVLLPKPGRIALDLRLKLPRIRDRNDDRLFHYQKMISSVLREEEIPSLFSARKQLSNPLAL